VPRKKRHAGRSALTERELAAEDAAELPPHDALSLIDPGLLAMGTQSGTVPGADQTTADSTQTAGQTATNLSDLATQTTSDAASAGAAGSQPYQPSLTSVAP
jgi:hypothetical protein